MGIYFTRRCPRCNFILEYFKRTRSTIGNPYLDCPACGSKIRLDNTKEWDEFTTFGKACHIFAHTFMSLLYGSALVVAACVIAPRLFEFTISFSGADYRNSLYIIVASTATAGILALLRAIWLIKKVKESVIRTRKRKSQQDSSAPATIIKMGGEVE